MCENINTHANKQTKLYGSQEYINFPKLEVSLFGHKCLLLLDIFQFHDSKQWRERKKEIKRGLVTLSYFILN